MRAKIWTTYILLTALLLAMVAREFQSKDEHERFSEDVREFMKAGGRNTSTHGLALCKRLRDIEIEYHSHHDHPFEPANCEEIYAAEQGEGPATGETEQNN